METMFYTKAKISDGCEICTSIRCDNVYYRCAGCGAEDTVDLGDWADFISENGVEALGCKIYCDECSKKHRRNAVD